MERSIVLGVKRARSTFQPTDEQRAIVERVGPGDSLKITALAGTGKTSTLEAIGRAYPQKSMLYICFNKSVAEEARLRMPGNVEPRTAHSLAWQSVGQHYKHKQQRSFWSLKLGLAPVIERELRKADKKDTAGWIFPVLETIGRYQWSADTGMDIHHVPASRRSLDVELLLHLAGVAWAAMADRESQAPITDDTYLKLWQLKRPSLRRDIILFDESQDANPVMLDVVRRLSGTQQVFVGDANQQIYAWRGAQNALASLDLPSLSLTQSFRFGPAIASTANRILAAKGEALRVRGAQKQDVVAVSLDNGRAPDVLLARTNAGLVADALAFAQEGRTIAAVGGLDSIVRQIEAAYELYARDRTRHPNFVFFSSWDELVTAAESENGQEYRPFVTIVNQYRQQIPSVCARLRAAELPEGEADVLLCTVHRFKGKEGEHVRLSTDLRPFVEEMKRGRGGASDDEDDDDGPRYVLNEEEANLDYVAVTRAKAILELGMAFAEALNFSCQHAPVIERPAIVPTLPPTNGAAHQPTLLTEEVTTVVATAAEATNGTARTDGNATDSDTYLAALGERLDRGSEWLKVELAALDAGYAAGQAETEEWEKRAAKYMRQECKWRSLWDEYAALRNAKIEASKDKSTGESERLWDALQSELPVNGKPVGPQLTPHGREKARV